MGAGSVKVMQEGGLIGLGPYDNPSVFISKINESKTLFDVGLKLGYQHYFDESENHGIRVGLGIGGGVPSIDFKASKNVSAQNYGDGKIEKFLIESTYKAFSLKTSLEVDYLWDFFNRGDHTIGLDVGLGYEMGVWFGKTTGSSLNQDINVQYSAEEKATTLLSHTIYPKIGIHYYYGNHQFNLAYKFGGILGGIKTENKGDVDWTIKDNATGEIMQRGGKAPSVQTIQSSPSYISFGYSYRF